jgi:ubiquinone/menaquinone biosynthesis C-methylase UbiE
MSAAHIAGKENTSTLLDVPSGGGTLLRLLDRAAYKGRVVEIDLSAALLTRANSAARDVPFETAILQADALQLPLRDETFDVVVSINGLHVMPDPVGFLAELRRVLRPGGELWIVTPVSATSLRSRLILGIAHRWNVISRQPPTLEELRQLFADVGLMEVEWLEGTSITGFRLARTS